jgi:hypothetical protein
MITDLQTIKRIGGISDTDTSDNDILFELQKAVEDRVQTQICGRMFEQATFTEILDGDGSNVIMLRNYPVVSITSINEDVSRAFDAATIIPATDYTFDAPAGIIKSDSYFVKWAQSIKVIYVAGYTASQMPADLKIAVCKLIIAEYLMSKGSINSVQQFEGDDRQGRMQKEALNALERYKAVRFG